MKKRLVLFLFTILIFSCNELYSQEPCKVLKKEISDKYSGKCKVGLAQGTGVAEGIDKYEGQFKNGLPHGNGTYTYSTGEVYKGRWKDGKRNGEGTVFYKKDGEDSVKYGYWESDVFIKKIDIPKYKVLKIKNVARLSFRKIINGNRVLFAITKGPIVNDQIFNLTTSPSSGNQTSLGSKWGFDNIQFPFKCRLTYTTANLLGGDYFDVELEFEINEAGEWEVLIDS